MLATILSLIGQLLPTILQNVGVIGSGAATLIQNLSAAIANLFTNLAAGQSKVQDGQIVLAAMAGVIAVLQANTNLPPALLTTIANIDKDVQVALAAYVSAEGGLNLTVYQQIAPVS